MQWCVKWVVLPFASIALCLLTASYANAAIMIDVLGPDVWDPDEIVMDGNLGITPAYLVEDFEDSTLIPGLEIQINDVAQVTLYDGPANGIPQVIWDGDSALQNFDSGAAIDGKDVDFNFTTGVVAFGVGISHESPFAGWELTIEVNGLVSTVADDDPDWAQISAQKNGWVWITANDGDVITQVSFNHSIDGGDGVFYDHAAVLVPEPSTLVLLGMGLVGFSARRRSSYSMRERR